MTMMKALVQNGFGQPEDVLSIKEVPKPTLGTKKNHALVKVYATSVNTPDWASTLGVPYILRPLFGGFSYLFGGNGPKDRIMGSDIAGIVEEILYDDDDDKKENSNKNNNNNNNDDDDDDEYCDIKVGDEVFGSTGDWLLGAFAEYAIVPINQLIKKPKKLSFEEAAGAVMSGITARAAIREAAKVTTNTHICINGASGSIGTFCIQMAKVDGGTVTGVCSTKNIDFIKSLGADYVIDYTKQDYTLPETLQQKSNKSTNTDNNKNNDNNNNNEREYYDMILDNVMNRPYDEMSRVLKQPNGYIIPNSMGCKQSEWFGAIPYFFWKPSTYPTVDCITNQKNLIEVANMLRTGNVKVIIDKVYTLQDAPKAIQHMSSLHARGQVIIKIQ